MLDEKDLDFIEGLQNLGVNQNVAKLITYLKEVDEDSSKDIEMATGMRQPEVSVALGTLRTMKWISEHDVKGNGTGRPTGIYSLRITIQEIIQHYEEEKNSEAARTMQVIQRLKELSPAL